jgi:signal transduction histidine kinase
MSDPHEPAVDEASDAVPPLAVLLGEGRLGAAAGHVTSIADLLLEEIVADGRPAQARIDVLLRELADVAAVTSGEARALLYLAGLRGPTRLSLPLPKAIEVVVALFCALGPVERASVWNRGADGKLVHVTGSDEAAATRSLKSAASAAIAGREAVDRTRGRVHAVAIATRPAALAYRCRPAETATAAAYADEAAATLGLLFLMDELLSRSADRERSLVESGERRLVRVGFDLHDGPMQDIAVLAQDVRLFRAQLATILEGNEHERIALGRVDDLEARLLALDQDLREIAASLQSPTVLRLPFTDALAQEVEGFGAEAQLEFELQTSGDFDEMTSSQKIALLRVIQESLANVREHAGASHVSVRVDADRARLTAEITDDGRGFAVERRLVQAARAGRLGLVGMGERIRLLGGRFHVESTPGGPTRVHASIPRWRPLGELQPDGAEPG